MKTSVSHKTKTILATSVIGLFSYLYGTAIYRALVETDKFKKKNPDHKYQITSVELIMKALPRYLENQAKPKNTTFVPSRETTRYSRFIKTYIPALSDPKNDPKNDASEDKEQPSNQP